MRTSYIKEANIHMAMIANMPFVLSAGMGLNAYFTYTVVEMMGYSWQVALFAVFAEGLIFILLSLTNIREAIFNSIPLTLKRGVSVGIGLFIANHQSPPSNRQGCFTLLANASS